jgi:hypothetical protein
MGDPIMEALGRLLALDLDVTAFLVVGQAGICPMEPPVPSI